MATETTTVEQQSADDELAAAHAELAALRAQLAQAAPAQPADSEEPPAKPTHALNLACGHSVESAVPVSSHHFCETCERTAPVVSAFELREED